MAEQSSQGLSRRQLLGGGAAFGGMLLAVNLIDPGSMVTAAAAPIDPADDGSAAFRSPGAVQSLQKVAAASNEVYPDSWALTPFPLAAVALGESVFTRAQQQALVLYRAYSVDRLLAVFRRNAGLDYKSASPPGGWEEFGPNPDGQRWGPAEYVRGQNTAGAGGLLRGHYAGHFLSGFSMAYASTGEEALLDKVNAMVDGLEECRAALAAQTYDDASRYSHPGFLSAYGEWQFSALEEYAPYGEIWAPYYTLHKILAGLLDAYTLAGSSLALQLAEGIGHWVYSRLSKCTQSQLQRMWGLYIAGEYGGMNESLVELYWLSEDARRDEFLAAAKLFTLDTLVDATSAGVDILNGKHANQHIPMFTGYIKLHGETGEARYLNAAKGLFDQVVPGRMYAHGGTGEGELWGPANTVAGDIGSRNAESCAAYNMLKVARYLFLNDQDPKYMDYYERTVLNHILGGRRNSESTSGPENLYMFPVGPGARKEYGNGNIGTCCGGTALESHAKYQDSIYFRAKDGSALWVNLYIASTLSWQETGLVLEQVSSYPESDTPTFKIVEAPTGPLTINLRIPSWVVGDVEITIDGVTTTTSNTPGSYVALTEEWEAGTEIAVKLPLRLWAEATIDRKDIQNLHYGPVALAATDSSTRYLKVSLAGLLGLDGSISRGFVRKSGNVFELAGRTFEPAYNGKDVAYHMYFQRAETTVAFAGLDSGVRNAQRGELTLLDEVWAKAPFVDRAGFLGAVQDVSLDYLSAGLISSRDRQKILLTAGRAPIDVTK